MVLTPNKAIPPLVGVNTYQSIISFGRCWHLGLTLDVNTYQSEYHLGRCWHLGLTLDVNTYLKENAECPTLNLLSHLDPRLLHPCCLPLPNNLLINRFLPLITIFYPHYLHFHIQHKCNSNQHHLVISLFCSQSQYKRSLLNKITHEGHILPSSCFSWLDMLHCSCYMFLVKLPVLEQKHHERYKVDSTLRIYVNQVCLSRGVIVVWYHHHHHHHGCMIS